MLTYFIFLLLVSFVAPDIPFLCIIICSDGKGSTTDLLGFLIHMPTHILLAQLESCTIYKGTTQLLTTSFRAIPKHRMSLARTPNQRRNLDLSS